MGLTALQHQDSASFLPPCLGNAAPIGVVDSGLGGLSVVAALKDALPSESIIYYADTAYCPYGTRDAEVVLDRLLTITHELLESGIKMLVLACNTGQGTDGRGLAHAIAAEQCDDLAGADIEIPKIFKNRCRAQSIGIGTIGIVAR